MGEKLQLEPWEYQAGGYFYQLTQWLDAHMAEFGFYRPFSTDTGGVAAEPWHLSYHPLGGNGAAFTDTSNPAGSLAITRCGG